MKSMRRRIVVSMIVAILLLIVMSGCRGAKTESTRELTIVTFPAGLKAVLDGKEVGTTPTIASLSDGQHELQINGGKKPFTAKFEADGSRSFAVLYVAEDIGAATSTEIAAPPGTSIYFRSSSLGQVPLTLITSALTSGELEAACPGFVPVRLELEMAGSRPAKIDISLSTKLPSQALPSLEAAPVSAAAPIQTDSATIVGPFTQGYHLEPQLSPDGSRFAVVDTTLDTISVYSVRNGSPTCTGVVTWPGTTVAITQSGKRISGDPLTIACWRDSRRLVFSASELDPSGGVVFGRGIWQLDAEANQLTRLAWINAALAGDAWRPALAADGRTYIADRYGWDGEPIWFTIVDLDSGNASEQSAEIPIYESARNPVYYRSPDGWLAAYQRPWNWGSPEQATVYLLDHRTGVEKAIFTCGDEWIMSDLQWAPDSRYVALNAARPSDNYVEHEIEDGCIFYPSHLLIVSTSGEIVADINIPGEVMPDVSWSPDSRHLVVTAGHQDGFTGEYEAAVPNMICDGVYRFGLDGTSERIAEPSPAQFSGARHAYTAAGDLIIAFDSAAGLPQTVVLTGEGRRFDFPDVTPPTYNMEGAYGPAGLFTLGKIGGYVNIVPPGGASPVPVLPEPWVCEDPQVRGETTLVAAHRTGEKGMYVALIRTADQR